ncbi:MAG: thioredoxin family protein [Defluviitaleaceae bacterium]|nr:thioredoxin family protein [Defluviitaleaceae bacterium]
MSTLTNNLPVANLSGYGIDHTDVPFLQLEMKDAVALIQDETFNGILYFGFPGCPWCRAAVPILNEAAKETDTTIYYVDRSHGLRTETFKKWDLEMATWLDTQIFMKKMGDVPNIYVPQIIHLKAGKVVDSQRSVFDKDSRDDRSLGVFDAHAQRELLNRYTAIFSQVSLG